MELKRTNSSDQDFRSLVDLLNADLAKRDGAEHAYYAQFNGINMLKNVVVAYEDNKAVGCGAFKVFEENTSVEIKRMYVLEDFRGKGIATTVLNELEQWARELDYSNCLLETGRRQPEAVKLYIKMGYEKAPNYGPYKGIENSLCFEKQI